MPNDPLSSLKRAILKVTPGDGILLPLPTPKQREEQRRVYRQISSVARQRWGQGAYRMRKADDGSGVLLVRLKPAEMAA